MQRTLTEMLEQHQGEPRQEIVDPPFFYKLQVHSCLPSTFYISYNMAVLRNTNCYEKPTRGQRYVGANTFR